MFEILRDRTVIKITGNDVISFLQGILTKNIENITDQVPIYSLMLTPQGKYLYDFFLIKIKEEYYLDIAAAQHISFLTKLNIYKLRANVSFNICSNLCVLVTNRDIPLPEAIVTFIDPRSSKLGTRIYLEYSKLPHKEEEIDYHHNRITNLIPEGYYDMVSEKSFPLEYGFDKIGAIDFDKGCYVGQELIARTHFRGTIRKTLCLLSGDNFPSQGTEILLGNRKIGIMASSFGTNGLALLRIEDLEEIKNNSLIVNSTEYKIVSRLQIKGS